jgi:hypothetical protein
MDRRRDSHVFSPASVGGGPDAVKFCSECGTETVAPDAADQVIQLQESVRALSERVGQLEVSGKGSAVSKFSWPDVPGHQKWKVTWGVFGRTILINIGIYVGIVFFILVVLGLAAAAGQ